MRRESAAELAGHTGEFVCTAPHARAITGRWGRRISFTFQYADGTPYFPFGTTTYAYLFTARRTRSVAERN